MRALFLVIFSVSQVLFLAVPCLNAQKSPVSSSQNPRVEKIINSNWAFNYFPDADAGSGYENPGFNDYGWPAVSLPHTWSTYETTGEVHPYIKNRSENENPYWWNGWGWYRKRFTLNPDYPEKKIFIEFEGVQKYCKVWINGEYLGDHAGGYSPFTFDLTGHINQGKENVIAVAVSNRQDDSLKIPPMSAGRFNIYSGIFRNVRIVIKDKLYIPMQGSAKHEGGTFITTPMVTEKRGIVRVQTWVKNDYSQAKQCILNTYIYNSDGEMVRVMRSKYTLSPSELFRFDQTLKPVSRPKLWSTDDPYLYSIRSEVTEGGRKTDNYISPLGFRQFRWDDDENCLYLNGRKIILKGINRADEYPWLGGAVPDWITEMELEHISEKTSYNLLKTSSCPGSPLVYDLADKLGLIVLEELPNTGDQEFSPAMQEIQEKEMIRRDRNHPGVIFWSMGDETPYPADSKIARAEDATRIITSRRVTNNVAVINTMHQYDDLSIDDFKSLLPVASDESSGSMERVKGTPSRLHLESSHERILADRGSVVILTADITDSNGNPVSGATNTVKWSVSGPASLVGPDLYESAIRNTERAGEEWYTEMPVVNIIRSTGLPGRITVTVSASGLSSGICYIEARDIEPDNSVISEALLSNQGRRPVTRLQFGVDRIDDIPQEIKESNSDIEFTQTGRSEYANMIKDYILENNPDVDSSTVEFRELVNLFASQLLNSGGKLVAFDYNYSVNNYNNCRLISGYIEPTKLPDLFKEGLREYYSGAIIREGNKMNAGDEMNWMNWIPSGGTVVISQEKGAGKWPRGTVITDKTSLTDLITTVYPVFSKYGDEAKDRALTFVNKMNPYVNSVTSVEIIDGEEVEKVSYQAEQGKPILIPQLKFISR